MSTTGTRTFRRIVANRRFDPRLVTAGVVVLVVLALGWPVLFGQSSKQADDVAAPVAALCREGGEAGAKLATSGACRAAGDVATGVGPYKSDANPTVQGARGAPGIGIPGASGTPGAPGAAGTNATGTPGTPGKDATGVPGAPGRDATGAPGAPGENASGMPGAPGQSPPCLSEATQCRGPEGKQGEPGKDASLPSSYTKTYPDGTTESCTRNGGADTDPVWACTTSTPDQGPELTDDPVPEPMP